MLWNLFLIIIAVFLFSFAYAAASGAPWVPIWRHDTKRIKKLLNLKPGDKFYELGCGTGTMCLAMARDSQIQVIGVELSLGQWLIAQLRKIIGNFRNIRYQLGNLFNTDLTEADAVYIFLYPATNLKLRPKLERELRPGTQVISYVFPIKGWEPVRIDKEPGHPDIYLYQV